MDDSELHRLAAENKLRDVAADRRIVLRDLRSQIDDLKSQLASKTPTPSAPPREESNG
ncbi:MAG: hypothetical protein ABI592_01150 [Acidobacteriota bacterium]